MQDILKVAGGVFLGILMLDALAFGLWIASGQMPIDNMYAGTITAHTLRLVLGF